MNHRSDSGPNGVLLCRHTNNQNRYILPCQGALPYTLICLIFNVRWFAKYLAHLESKSVHFCVCLNHCANVSWCCKMDGISISLRRWFHSSPPTIEFKRIRTNITISEYGLIYAAWYWMGKPFKRRYITHNLLPT